MLRIVLNGSSDETKGYGNKVINSNSDNTYSLTTSDSESPIKTVAIRRTYIGNRESKNSVMYKNWVS